MHVTITARHLDVQERFKERVRSKLEKFKKYSENIEEAHVVFSAERITYVSEITLVGKRMKLIQVEKGQGLDESFDKCVSRMERQLERFFEKVKDHRVKRFLKSISELSFMKGPKEEQMHVPKIIKTESFAVKPMSEEEAAMELELFKQDFIVFRNAKDEKINVIYRRKDKNYGLIEA